MTRWHHRSLSHKISNSLPLPFHLRLTFHIHFFSSSQSITYLLLNSFSSVQLKNYKAWTNPEYAMFLYKSMCSNKSCDRKEMCRTVCFTATFTDVNSEREPYGIRSSTASTSVDKQLSQFCECVGNMAFFPNQQSLIHHCWKISWSPHPPQRKPTPLFMSMVTCYIKN